MRIFAISDLHFGKNVDKPMGVFGSEWEGHTERIAENWRQTVNEDDLVLLPGDLSWAMRMEDAGADLKLIESLPGHKVFIRGNHDFWFSGPVAVRSVLGRSLEFVRFDACVYNGIGICGVRGWPWPGYGEYDESADRRHYARELERLRLSLEALSRLSCSIACAMIHYPPLVPGKQSEFCSMFRRAGIDWVVYGHVHGPSERDLFEGEADGVKYVCVSADHVGFRPRKLFEV